jgi:hypothetical protein
MTLVSNLTDSVAMIVKTFKNERKVLFKDLQTHFAAKSLT